MTDPDLTAAIRDLHQAIVSLTDERQGRQAEQASIKYLVVLHQQPRAPNAKAEACP